MVKNAFSLVEFSVVLIIMGLVAAGIVGGASLIENAKVQASITQFNDLKTSLISFSTSKNRLPGDINNNDCIGYYQPAKKCGNTTFETTGDNCDSCGHYIDEYEDKNISSVVGPFVDLYLSKLLAFKPNPNSDNLELLTLPSITYIDDVLPISQIDKEQAKMFFITEDEGPVIMHYTKDENALYDMATLDPKFLQKIDAKIDDAEYNKGIFRTSADYEISIVNNNKLEGCKFYIPELNF